MESAEKKIDLDEKIKYLAYSTVETVNGERKEVHSFMPSPIGEKAIFQHKAGPNRQMRRNSKKMLGRMNSRGTYHGFSPASYKDLDNETQKELWERRKIKLAIKGKPFISKEEKEKIKKKAKNRKKES